MPTPATKPDQWPQALILLTQDPLMPPAALAAALPCHPSRAAAYIRRYREGGGGGNLPNPDTNLTTSVSHAAKPTGSALSLLEGAQLSAAQAVNLQARALLQQASQPGAQVAGTQAAVLLGIVSDKVRDLRKADARAAVWEDILATESPAVLDDMIEEQSRMIGALARRSIPLD